MACFELSTSRCAMRRLSRFGYANCSLVGPMAHSSLSGGARSAGSSTRGRAMSPWSVQSSYDLSASLDPGDEYDCEIGIPAGFAISQSRKAPVTISLQIVTLGIEDRVIVQDIKRQIAV